MGKALAVVATLALSGCSGSSGTGTTVDMHDAGESHDAGHVVLASLDAAVDATDAEAGAPGGFITGVVSFDPGPCAGYGGDDVLGSVEGPPQGGGASMGSTSVVSLGNGGTIVVSFAPDSIIDGPGTDFIVFENTFIYDGVRRDAEPGEVSVSEDGVHWTTFPCSDTSMNEPDGGWGATECAGLNPVYSNPDNDISPTDVAKAGGDDFDLARIGVTSAKYVRIRSVVTGESCPDGGDGIGKNGFDLDAIAIVNGSM